MLSDCNPKSENATEFVQPKPKRHYDQIPPFSVRNRVRHKVHTRGTSVAQRSDWARWEHITSSQKIVKIWKN